MTRGDPAGTNFTVLGASGSIGGRLQRSLEEDGAEVFAPARGDPELFARSLGRVFYCVGLTGDFRARPLETVEAHVGLLRDVLDRADFDSLLYLSSTRVYRGLELGEEDEALLVRPEDPDDLYNASKLLGEALCLSSPRGRSTVARLSNVVGPGARSHSFASSLLEVARGGGAITIDSRPESVKDYVDIRDVVELLPRLLDGRHRIYNVASGCQTSHRRLAELVTACTSSSVDWAEEPSDGSFPPISIARVVEEFNFSARPLRDSVEEMVSAG